MWLDTREYEAIYDYKIRLKIALDKKDWSNTQDIINIILEARKTWDKDIMKEIYSEIAKDSINYEKILERIIDEPRNISNAIKRIKGSLQSRSLRQYSDTYTLNAYTNFLGELRESYYTNKILSDKKYQSQKLPKGFFDIDWKFGEANSPFKFLVSENDKIQNEITDDIKWLKDAKSENEEKEKKEEKKGFRNFLKKYVFFGE